jgi:hypothetical protein
MSAPQAHRTKVSGTDADSRYMSNYDFNPTKWLNEMLKSIARMKTNNTVYDLGEMKRDAKTMAEEVQLFIFKEDPLPSFGPHPQKGIDPDEISFPFPVMGFQIMDNCIYTCDINTPELKKAQWPIVCLSQECMFLVADTKARCFWELQAGVFKMPDGSLQEELHGIMHPWDDVKHKHSAECQSYGTLTCGIISKQLGLVFSGLLDGLEKQKIIKRKNCTSVRIKKPGKAKKKIRIPKPFVYIIGKSQGSGSGEAGDTEMIYAHQWRVRGHWRIIATIGKDFRGNYNQNGRTWVSDHIKGPDDKPLVEKYRVASG